MLRFGLVRPQKVFLGCKIDSFLTFKFYCGLKQINGSIAVEIHIFDPHMALSIYIHDFK